MFISLLCIVVVFALSCLLIKYHFHVLVSGLKSLSKLDVLTLDYNEINGSKLRESLQAFSSIRVLFMEHINVIGTITAGGTNTFYFNITKLVLLLY